MQKNNLVLAALVVAVVVLAFMVFDLRSDAGTDRIMQDRSIGSAVDSLRSELEYQRQRDEWSREMSDSWR